MAATFGDGEMMQSGYERFMESWRHVINVSEKTLIDNVAATVPWLAPVSPAYMAWHNAVTLLGWPAWVAWVVAAAIEGLGLSVISTAFQLWKDRRDTFLLAVGTAVFYLAVVIVVNIGLELGWPVWIAKALLSLLSVPAAVTIALRSQNAQVVELETVKAEKLAEEQRLADEQARAEKLAEALRAEQARIADEERAYARQKDAEERARRHELKLKRASGEFAGKLPESAVSHRKVTGEQTYKSWHEVPESEYAWIAAASTAEIVEKYNLGGKDPERLARQWKGYAKKATEVSHA